MLERENIEWTQHYWYNVADEQQFLPRVMLIGDSIVAMSRENTSKRLRDIATVMGFSTSKIVGDPAYFRELSLAMADYPIDLIVLNNGLHGMTDTFSDEYYERSLRQLLDFLQINSPARLMWRSSTPVTEEGHPEKLHQLDGMVVRRNAIAARIMKEYDIPVIDAYRPLLKHPEFKAADGVHYLPEGCEFIGDLVGKHIAKYLKQRKLAMKIGKNITTFPGRISNFCGYERHDFELNGSRCIMICPNQTAGRKSDYFLNENLRKQMVLDQLSRDALRQGMLVFDCPQKQREAMKSLLNCLVMAK